MARHCVDICGVNTANINVLSNDEMIFLFLEYAKGNQNAKEKLITGNLKLVLAILKKYQNRVDNLDDLFQIGCVGLIKAIDNFDLKYDVRFSTYAVPMILGEIKRYLRDNSSLKVTRNLKDLAFKGLKIKEQLINKLNREPTVNEIAKELMIDEITLMEAFDSAKEAVSMFEPIYNDSGDAIYLSDQIADKKDKLGNDVRIMLKDAINKLKEKEKYVICKRYFEGITQIELAEIIGISQAQVSRIEKNGLDCLKKNLR